MATYHYLQIPAGVPFDPSKRMSPTALRLGLERQIDISGINLADRLDLEDGSRIYRVNDRDVWKLPRDQAGPFLINSEKVTEKLRFTTTDPSEDLPIEHDWVNIRS